MTELPHWLASVATGLGVSIVASLVNLFVKERALRNLRRLLRRTSYTVEPSDILLLKVLADGQELSRIDIAVKARMTPTDVKRVLGELIANGWVHISKESVTLTDLGRESLEAAFGPGSSVILRPGASLDQSGSSAESESALDSAIDEAVAGLKARRAI